MSSYLPRIVLNHEVYLPMLDEILTLDNFDKQGERKGTRNLLNDKGKALAYIREPEGGLNKRTHV